MQLYHGSSSSKLVGKLRVGKRDSGWFGSGFYLTQYPDYAKRWGDNIHTIEVPDSLKLAKVNAPDGYSKLEFLGDSEIANKRAGGINGWISDEDAWSKSFTAELKRMGYDGVTLTLDSYEHAEVVIFEPEKLIVTETFLIQQFIRNALLEM